MWLSIDWRFNSRTPCGVRPSSYCAVPPQGGFNSRTPCGVRPVAPQPTQINQSFQFTHPVWGATPARLLRRSHRRCFNSRTPCGVRQRRCSKPTYLNSFNSRTPCGVRHPVHGFCTFSELFQFTHPVWGATTTTAATSSSIIGFNSRTPCGVRQSPLRGRATSSTFQFTHPVWGATYLFNLD